jgi:hypothetical protein
VTLTAYNLLIKDIIELDLYAEIMTRSNHLHISVVHSNSLPPFDLTNANSRETLKLQKDGKKAFGIAVDLIGR